VIYVAEPLGVFVERSRRARLILLKLPQVCRTCLRCQKVPRGDASALCGAALDLPKRIRFS
jgi:hypothetical protein